MKDYDGFLSTKMNQIVTGVKETVKNVILTILSVQYRLMILKLRLKKNRKFLESEIVNENNKLKTNEAPEPDEITGEIPKHLGIEGISVIPDMYKKIWKSYE